MDKETVGVLANNAAPYVDLYMYINTQICVYVCVCMYFTHI